MTRQRDVEPIGALAAVLDAVFAGHRNAATQRDLRANDRTAAAAGRPARYAVAGVLAGTTGALALAAFNRLILPRLDRTGSAPDRNVAGTPEQHSADSARVVVDRVAAHRSATRGGSLAVLRPVEQGPDVTKSAATDGEPSVVVNAGRGPGRHVHGVAGTSAADRRA